MATILDEVLEGTTPDYTATLKDRNNVNVATAALTAIRLTFYSVESGSIINSRVSQDVFNNVLVPEITYDDGDLLWKLAEEDTLLVDVPKPALGHHKMIWVFEWEDAEAVPRQKVHEVVLPIARALLAGFDAPP